MKIRNGLPVKTKKMRDIPTHDWYDITTTDVKQALAKSQKWKSPGRDKVPNLWLHHLSSTHKHIAKALSHVIKTPEDMPSWLTNVIYSNNPN